MQRLSQLRRADASSGLVLLVVCAAVVLASLDLFIVNVALPEMAADLGNPDLADLSWVLNGYAIVYAAFLLLFGRMAERRRRDLASCWESCCSRRPRRRARRPSRCRRWWRFASCRRWAPRC